MCRFTFYQGKPIRVSSLLFEPKHSLVNQSFASTEREEPLNGDGFGLAWYDHKISQEPALFKSISPAWSNNNLLELSRMVESSCILAHVRAATQSLSVSETNCHPFKWKQFAFMHNGDIGGFVNVRRHLLNLLSDDIFNHIKGMTDSEHFFGLFLEEMVKNQEMESTDRLATSMMSAIRTVTDLVVKYGESEPCYMNMIVTDGHLSLAVRFTTDVPENADSLYLNLGKKYVCEDGVCYMKELGENEKSVIVSSEPLSNDPGWHAIPANSMVLVREGHILNQMDIVV
jgi:glutamine amidotransferase